MNSYISPFSPQSFCLCCTDILSLCIGTVPCIATASHFGICTGDFLICAATLSFFLPLFAFVFGWYMKISSPFAEFKRQYILSTLMAALVAGFAIFFERENLFSHLVLCFVGFGATLFLMPLLRSQLRQTLSHSSWWLSEVIVINHSTVGTEFCDFLQKHPEYGLLLRNQIVLPEQDNQIQYLKSVQERYPNALVMLLTDSHKQSDSILPAIKTVFSHVILVPLERELQSSFFDTIDLGLAKCLVLTHKLWNPKYIAWKRCMDLVLCTMLSILLIPFVLLIALAIRIESRGPVLYRQNRIGQNGRTIRIFKFRTMIANADEVLPAILANDPKLQEEWDLNHKLRNDPRVTKIGAFLRKVSLDEIPQILNIFLGEMSLVGPRPIVAEEKEKYGFVFEEYCMVRPGLTGLWQVSGRNNTRYEERVAYDHLYINTWTPCMDLWILARTVPVVLSTVGAY